MPLEADPKFKDTFMERIKANEEHITALKDLIQKNKNEKNEVSLDLKTKSAEFEKQIETA